MDVKMLVLRHLGYFVVAKVTEILSENTEDPQTVAYNIVSYVAHSLEGLAIFSNTADIELAEKYPISSITNAPKMFESRFQIVGYASVSDVKDGVIQAESVRGKHSDIVVSR